MAHPQSAGGGPSSDGSGESASGGVTSGSGGSGDSVTSGGSSSGSATSGGGLSSGDGSEASATTAGGGVASGPCATLEVRDIFRANCTEGVCHDSTQPAAQLDLSGADPAAQMLGVASSLCDGQVQLVAGHPEQSFLWLKLTESTPACGDPMPLGEMLSDGELACLEQWIVGLGSGVPDCETCGGELCVDVSNDTQHCGECGVVCDAGQVCEAGRCVGCSEGQTACGTRCVVTSSDPNHCGACGVACGAGESCVEGSCQCSTSELVTFSQDIAPLLEESCASNACHGARRPKQDLALAATVSYDSLVGIAASQCNDGRLLVAPGAPAQSYLLHKLTGVDLCSGSLMPKADGAWPQENVAKLSAWICSGAPNN